MKNLINYLIDHWEVIIGIIIAYLSLVVPFFMYFLDKRKEEKHKRFENYHNLLNDLLGGNRDQVLKLDRQAAIVFELRNFSEYYPVSLRILNNLKKDFGNYEIVMNEILLTEKYIKSPWYIKISNQFKEKI